jgi:succinate dehydrogenase / fumarate reductase, flavoprotein subunit
MTPSKAVIFGREKLHVLGEANFSDHGANRLGASALMQGLADGYFVIPSTIANYLALCAAY